MTERSTQLRDTVLTLAGIGVLFAILRLSAEIVVPFLLSLFIATVAATPLAWLKRRGLSTMLSVVAVLLAIIIVMGGISMLLAGTATEFNDALPGYQERLKEVTGKSYAWLSSKDLNVDEVGLSKIIDPSAVFGFANSMFAGIRGTLSYILLIIFTTTFMLAETAGFQRKLAAIDSKEGSDGDTLQSMAAIARSLNRYVGAKAIVSLATGVLVWIALELVGLDFAPLWGVLAFLLNFVPNIGSILAAVPAVLIAVLQLPPPMVVVVIAIYLTVNLTIGNVIEPMVMGQRVGLSTLTVFLSLIFWGWMFGAVGMLLSVPLSMVVKSIAETNAQTHWFAVLMGPVPPVEEGRDDEAAE
ncbi:AI-2E family transporter [Verrucomicrobiaceae bacterium N1E253]|uniref:AI-2E family transporter n=1 Tax=Oceaniferula marina TaxID=2748318 RepID=A0A851GHE9_9BACT|nr:AI-2E family transporter [Oceaniferula marina]NWK56953.1 AI-2E family transporter [Oceaniferula marina]